MRRSPKKQKSLFFITTLILITLPIVIGHLLTQSFDIRNRAASPENSPNTGCTITIPNVNSQTIPLNTKVHVEVQIDRQKISDPIKNIIIINNRNEVVFTSTKNKSRYIFSVIPKTLGELEFYGSANTDKQNVVCVYKDARKSAKVIKTNLPPDFITNPYVNATPSNNIKINEKYEYRLIANDKDRDKIRHLFIFSKKFPWLNEKVDVSGENGNLEILFSGKSSKPGSYLATVFIYDGYNNHIKSQNWIINVEDETVSIPHIYIEKASLKDQSFIVNWDVESKFPITKQTVFITQSPSNPDKWILVKDNLPGNAKSINIDMSKYKAGIYAVIIKAFDSQNPARYGLGITPQMLEYKSKTKSQPASDIVQLEYPQILNITPKENAHIQDVQPAIQASLIPSIGNAIIKDSVTLKIDNQVITNILNNQTDTETGINITFIPKSPLTPGSHTITLSFQDSSKKEASKTWTFTIDQKQSFIQTIKDLFENKQAGLIILIGFFIVFLTFIITLILYIKQRTQKPKSFIPNLPKYRKNNEYEGQTFNSAVDPFSRIDNYSQNQQTKTPEAIKPTQPTQDTSKLGNKDLSQNNQVSEEQAPKENPQSSLLGQKTQAPNINQTANTIHQADRLKSNESEQLSKDENLSGNTPIKTSAKPSTTATNTDENVKDNMINDIASLVSKLQEDERRNKKLSFLENTTQQRSSTDISQQQPQKKEINENDSSNIQTNEDLIPKAENTHDIKPPTVL